jgi:small subunit ribosomal protein S8
MDTVGEFLTRIRNAGSAGHDKVDVPSSKFRLGLAEILLNAGLIRSFKLAKDTRQGVMRVYLKYSDSGRHVITQLERVSRPGRRIYVKSENIPVVKSGLGTTIVSTNQGLMTGEQAKIKKLGGEFICKIW